MKKNVASQKWRVFAFNRTTNAPVTGDAANITAKIAKDHGTATALGDTNPTEVEDGYYLFDVTQAETNADVLALYPESSTADVQVIGDPPSLVTVVSGFSDDAMRGTDNAATETKQDAAKTVIDTVAVDVANIDGATVPSAASIADAVWDEAKSGHTSTGSFGASLQNAELSSNSAATEVLVNQAAIATVDTNVDTLLARVTSTLFSGITSLAEWLGLLAGKQSGDSTARTELRATGAGSGTFDETTDSLEAIRDRGDSNWAGGGALTDILHWRPSIPSPIDLSDATHTIAIHLTNALDDLPTTVEITPGTISIDRRSIGGSAWTSVVSDAAMSEAAGQVYYDEVFNESAGYQSGDHVRFTFKSQKITVSGNDYEISDSTGLVYYAIIRIGSAGAVTVPTGSTVNLGTMKTKLGYMLGDSAEDVYTAAKKTTAVNLAVDQVQQFFQQWDGKGMAASTTIAVTTGTQEYSIDSKIIDIEKVTVSFADGTTMQVTPIDFTETERYQGITGNDQQHVTHFYRRANMIGFSPVPAADETVTLHYTAWAGDLSLDSDTFTMPPWVRNLVLFKAASYCASFNGDMNAKRAFDSDYMEAKQEAQVTISTWQNAEPQRVKRRDLWEEEIRYVE